MEPFTDIPYVSKGKNEIVRRRQKVIEKQGGKTQSANGGYSKKLIVGGSILLCLISTIIVVIVLMSGNTDTGEEIQTQFTGRIQMVELDDEFVEWSEEMNDLTSIKAKELIDKITPKIKSAYNKEGFEVRNVEVERLSADAPKTVTRNEPAQSLGRAFLETQFQEKKYDNVQTINIGYKTQGTAKGNAVMVASIKSGRWGEIRNSLENRLAGEGITGKLSSANVVPDFLSSVSELISSDPVNVQLPLSNEPEIEQCYCDAVYKVDVICNCQSSCTDNNILILGGKDNYFSTHTKLCVSAYYAGLIKGGGGEFEVLSQGKFDNLEKGPDRRGFVPHGINWRLSVILLKNTGNVVTPTLPTNPATTTDPKEVQFKEDGMFIVHLQYNKMADTAIVYHTELQDIDSELSASLKSNLEPLFLAATKKLGFNEVSVNFIHFDRAQGNNGVIVSAILHSADSNAAQIAFDLEKKSPKRVNQLIKSGFPPNDINTLIGFRYSQKFIEEMKIV